MPEYLGSMLEYWDSMRENRGGSYLGLPAPWSYALTWVPLAHSLGRGRRKFYGNQQSKPSGSARWGVDSDNFSTSARANDLFRNDSSLIRVLSISALFFILLFSSASPSTAFNIKNDCAPSLRSRVPVGTVHIRIT